jgi:hypothetical protein
VSLLLMVPASVWFWNHLPLLGAIQMPFRLSTLLTVATAALAAIAMESVRQNWRSSRALPVGIALVLAAGWIVPLTRSMGRYESARFQLAPFLDYLISAWAQWTDPKLISKFGIPIDAEVPQVAPQNGSATVQYWGPRLIEFHVDSPSATWVTVKQFYFPGWTASIAERSLPLRPSSPQGLTMVQVPAGASQVRLELKRGVPELAGTVVSGITVISLIVIGFQSLRSKGER